MNIIAHRGYWLTKKEQNTLKSFERAFAHGFGVETDVRDYRGRLVIAHDPATAQAIAAEQLFRLFADASSQQILAINIKSTGLQDLLLKQIKRFHIQHYFAFDITVPDNLGYIRKKIKSFSRQSELEPNPALLKQTQGIWLDSFYSNWFSANLIEKHLLAGRKVCIVSPELHGRVYKPVWQMLRRLNKKHSRSLSLCTDLPEEAKQFFS